MNVRFTAKKRGTIVGKSGTFHFNPNAKDKLARKGIIPEDVAIEAERKGLISIDARTKQSASQTQYRTVAERGAERREQSSEQSDRQMTGLSEFFGTGGADTRDTTAFPKHPNSFVHTAEGEQRLNEDEDGRNESTDAEDELDEEDEEDEETDQEREEREDREEQEERDRVAALSGGGERGNAGGADAPPVEHVVDKAPPAADAGADTGTGTKPAAAAATAAAAGGSAGKAPNGRAAAKPAAAK